MGTMVREIRGLWVYLMLLEVNSLGLDPDWASHKLCNVCKFTSPLRTCGPHSQPYSVHGLVVSSLLKKQWGVRRQAKAVGRIWGHGTGRSVSRSGRWLEHREAQFRDPRLDGVRTGRNVWGNRSVKENPAGRKKALLETENHFSCINRREPLTQRKQDKILNWSQLVLPVNWARGLFSS